MFVEVGMVWNCACILNSLAGSMSFPLVFMTVCTPKFYFILFIVHCHQLPLKLTQPPSQQKHSYLLKTMFIYNISETHLKGAFQELQIWVIWSHRSEKHKQTNKKTQIRTGSLMVPACTGWFMIFCLWRRCLDFSQTIYGTILFLWDITVLYNLWLCWTSLHLCSWDVTYARDNGRNTV